MGLDMYLSKKTYVKNWRHDEENNYSVIARNNGKQIKHIQKERVSYVIEEVGYWRKANHIHNWFVENCQGGIDECQESDVSREQLYELKVLCNQVKDYLDTCKKVFNEEYKEYYTFEVDEAIIKEFLPTTSGFFFGGTDYDRWYYEDLEETIEIIDNAFVGVKEKDWSVEFTYQASW